MRSRLTATAALAAALAFTAPTTAVAYDAELRASLSLTSTKPGTPTGAVLSMTRPDEPNGKPKTEAVGVFKLPKGTTISHRAVPPCEANDVMLQVQGASACPASFVGAGSATVVTGLGSPVDPYTIYQRYYYAPGELVVLYSNNAGDSPVLKVGRIKIEGATFTAPLDLPPGYPPGTKTAPKDTDVAFDRYLGPQGAFITTPRTCPRSRRWVATVVLTYEDGSSDRASHATPCGRQRR